MDVCKQFWECCFGPPECSSKPAAYMQDSRNSWSHLKTIQDWFRKRTDKLPFLVGLPDYYWFPRSACASKECPLKAWEALSVIIGRLKRYRWGIFLELDLHVSYKVNAHTKSNLTGLQHTCLASKCQWMRHWRAFDCNHQWCYQNNTLLKREARSLQ